jgi:hypothetical protein
LGGEGLTRAIRGKRQEGKDGNLSKAKPKIAVVLQIELSSQYEISRK